ncbi:hypothetical protein C3497_09765 [Zoogloeaceae bacteirum Par-f-2]|nr:hypothetical protein C3497_09765 [Zoogloeaceae bacteirum Par-f-2]
MLNEIASSFRATKCIESCTVGLDKAKCGQGLDGRHSHGLCDVEISLTHPPETEIIFALQLGISAQATVTTPAIAFEGQPTGQCFNRIGHFNILHFHTLAARSFRYSHTKRRK